MNNPPSHEQVARLERKRLAAEDGANAIQEVAERAIAVRANMARLRTLRLAQEAEKRAMVRALHAGKPDLKPPSRRKRAKPYSIVGRDLL
jgi:hypothetical protein